MSSIWPVPAMTAAAVALLFLQAACSGNQAATQSASAPGDDLAATARRLPKAEAWMAARGASAFGFRRAPGGTATAWIEALEREDLLLVRPGHYALVFADRPDATVRSIDLGRDVSRAGLIVGPVWSADGARLAVGFHTTTPDFASPAQVLVVDARTGKETSWLSEPGVLVTGLSWSQDGTQLALSVHEAWSRTPEPGRDEFTFRVLKGPDQVVWRSAFPAERGWGAAASLSPDGNRVLAMSRSGVFLFEAGKPAPTRLGDIRPDATIFTAPQWSADGARAVAVAGGAVTFVDVRARTVRCVGEKELRGRAHDVAWVPDALQALVLVQHVADGSAFEVLLGAGHARQRYSTVPVLVSAAGGNPLALTALRTPTQAGMEPRLGYVPQATEAMSLWLR